MTPQNTKTPGERVAEIMRDKRLKSVRAYAIEVDIDPSYLNKIVKGEKDVPESLLVSLHKKYGVTADWIMTGEGKKYGTDNTLGIPINKNREDWREDQIQFLKEQNESLKEYNLFLKERLSSFEELIKNNLTEMRELAGNNKSYLVALFEALKQHRVAKEKPPAEKIIASMDSYLADALRGQS